MYTFIFCVVVADLITGVVHWFEDTYITPDWPILGKHVGLINIEHHQHPSWLGTMSTFVSRNIQTFSIGIVVLITYHLFFEFLVPVTFTIVLASFGNEIHTWTHMSRKRNYWWVTLLQDMAIIQNSHHHLIHHKKPYEIRYCTITNFVNPVLDLIRFWRALEWIILFSIGVDVQRGGQKREGV